MALPLLWPCYPYTRYTVLEMERCDGWMGLAWEGDERVKYHGIRVI